MNYENFFKYFDIPHYVSRNLIVSACPVHDGDNPNAFNITTSGEHEGKWFCNTNHCHEEYYGLDPLLRMTCKKKGVKYYPELFSEIFQGKQEVKVINDYSFLLEEEFSPPTSDIKKCPLKTNIPSKYYISRGFSPEILKTFEIGEFTSRDFLSEFYNRVVFPVYSHDGNYIGAVGRTLDEKYLKWKNSENFKKSTTLYGLWKTYKTIKEKGVIILVEGQGDFLKLYEAGVRNCAGMFSNFLCKEQVSLLCHMGVHTVILIKDNDKAGDKGALKIKRDLSEHFHLIIPEYSGKDLGDLPTETIKEKILPLIEEYV